MILNPHDSPKWDTWSAAGLTHAEMVAEMELSMLSPLEAICRKAKERRAYIVAHPDEFTTNQAAEARREIDQSKRLSLAATLRYE